MTEALPASVVSIPAKAGVLFARPSWFDELTMRASAPSVALMVSLSNHEGVAPQVVAEKIVEDLG